MSSQRLTALVLQGRITQLLATITAERPDTPDGLLLIDELQTHLESLYPPESRHGFSVERLIREGVAFFVLRVDGAPAGCAGIKLFGREYGELKRMYIRPEFRGRTYGELARRSPRRARASEPRRAVAPRNRNPPAGRDPAL
jgi:GNAT superfamily N-acetyltransferase